MVEQEVDLMTQRLLSTMKNVWPAIQRELHPPLIAFKCQVVHYLEVSVDLALDVTKSSEYSYAAF